MEGKAGWGGDGGGGGGGRGVGECFREGLMTLEIMLHVQEAPCPSGSH